MSSARRERILNMSSSLSGCQAFGEKKRGEKKQSIMFLTGSKSVSCLMRQCAVKKLVN